MYIHPFTSFVTNKINLECRSGNLPLSSVNEEYVQFPSHTEIVNWGIATDPQTVKIDPDGSGTTVTVNNILGVMYDKDAVVATMDRSRFVNKYDEWNDRNVFKLCADRRYVVDPTENAIIYLNS